MPPEKLSEFTREQLKHAQHRPRYRHGDYVAVTEQGRLYPLSPQVTGRSRDEVEKFFARLPYDRIGSIEAAMQTVHERAELRQTERQRFMDLGTTTALDGGFRNIETAAVRVPGRALDVAGNTAREFVKTGTALTATARGIGSLFGLFGNLLAPTLRPLTKEQHEKKTERENADLSGWLEQMDRLHQLEAEREPQREQQRHRERERGR